MLTLSKILAQVRRAILPDYGESEIGVQVHCNNRGELLQAPALPERAELVRQGNSWGAQSLVANASTFLVAQPTTAYQLLLFNGESAGGKTYLIDRIWLYGVTSMAAAQPATMIAAIVQVQNSPGTTFTAPTTAIANSSMRSLSGKSVNSARGYGGKGILGSASTLTAVPALTAGDWFPVGGSIVPSPTTNLGLAIEAFVYGRYMLPPGAAMVFNAIAGTAAGTFIQGVEWHEAQLAAVNP